MKISDFFVSGRFNSLNLKTFARPFILVLIIICVGFFIINNAISKISLQVSGYKIAKSEESALSTKLFDLKKISIGSLEKANKLVIALPDKNSVMVMISQIKKLAQEKNIIIGKLEISGIGSVNNLQSIRLSTQMNAQDLNTMIEYLKSIPNLAPVSNINEAKLIIDSENAVKASVDMTVFWSSFPTTIPSINEPIVGLTQEEESAVSIISNLKSPDYQALDPTTPGERVIPFD